MQILRSAFPQFAEQNQRGYMQQDAEEVWTNIVSCLDSLPGYDTSGTIIEQKKFIEQFFTGILSSRYLIMY